MDFIGGEDHKQTLLLPDSLEDYVNEDNPARMICTANHRPSLTCAQRLSRARNCVKRFRVIFSVSRKVARNIGLCPIM